MIKKIFFTILIFLIIILIISKTSLWFPLRSYFVMYIFSNMEERKSLIEEENIKFKIPGGISTMKRDWYPFVMIFNDDEGFSRYMGKKLSLTILYNFGHFQIKDGSSSYYNPNSKYFSSFYGGYLVRNDENKSLPFGFDTNNNINIKELTSVPKYDLDKLVLSSLGCPENKIIIDYSIDDIKDNIDYVGYKNWVKIDTTIKTNSPLHRYKEEKRAYIQYGRPIEKYLPDEDFPIITLKGRIYVKYFEEYNVTVFLYVICEDINTIEECDKEILSKSIIR